MRFAFVKEWRHIWQVQTICRVMQVTTRGFRAWLTRPMSQRQRGDISYIWTAQGWLYLAVILDLHSRRVVGWPFDFAQESATG